MASCGDRLTIEAFVFTPQKLPKGWTDGGLYQAVKELPGVAVRLDSDGEIARSYRVRTSGQTLLYSADGRLIFSGGLTASRGHEGDNDGCDAISDYVRTGKTDVSVTPVFGCSFGFSEESRGTAGAR